MRPWSLQRLDHGRVGGVDAAQEAGAAQTGPVWRLGLQLSVNLRALFNRVRDLLVDRVRWRPGAAAPSAPLRSPPG
eukprot:COSAG05_NODE_1296_length_5247_cov_2.705517_3_plen_76_part_00